MPSTTPGGLPIPLDTDPVADGAKALRDLAYDLEKWLQAGVAEDLPVAAVNTTYTRDIVFPVAFPSPPVVTLTLSEVVSVNTVSTLGHSNVTNTGFTIYYQRTAGLGALDVHWMARRR